MTATDSLWSNSLLDRMQYEADPLADATIAAILGPWQDAGPDVACQHWQQANSERWRRLALVSRLFETWSSNAAIDAWRAPPGTPPEVAQPVEAYLRAAPRLPDWADPGRIAIAEDLFSDHGVLSCTMLFCASLPECYVIPDLSAALQVTGQLVERTEHRIRSTAAMIFPVMMTGGLTAPHGGGLAQVLKVRLIHATIRNLILRGSPEQALAMLGGQRRVPDAGIVPSLATDPEVASSMHEALFAHGWNVGKDGLPINQEELAYTLLTFHYVFLRGMRKLGLGFDRRQEEAYLHAWNVVGHVLGLQRELMVETMVQGQQLFAQMQARGRADRFAPDPRPELGRALMQTMEQAIPVRVAKPMPRLLTRHLCGRETARDIGIVTRVSWATSALFVLILWITRAIDGLGRLIQRDFSFVRFVLRVIGRRFLADVLMGQTRPLKLPEHLRARADTMMALWCEDRHAPRWLNRLEARLTPPAAPDPS